jgi:hypothetical protein
LTEVRVRRQSGIVGGMYEAVDEANSEVSAGAHSGVQPEHA